MTWTKFPFTDKQVPPRLSLPLYIGVPSLLHGEEGAIATLLEAWREVL